MELTWILAASPFAVGIGYALLRRARRSRAVVWALVCASLVALATRDLFRSRRRDRPTPPSVDRTPSGRTATADGGEEPRWPLVARLRRRVANWFG